MEEEPFFSVHDVTIEIAHENRATAIEEVVVVASAKLCSGHPG